MVEIFRKSTGKKPALILLQAVELRVLAQLCESGRGVRQDLEEATRLMAQAAKNLVAPNCPEKLVWLQDLLLANPNFNSNSHTPRKPETGFMAGVRDKASNMLFAVICCKLYLRK